MEIVVNIMIAMTVISVVITALFCLWKLAVWTAVFFLRGVLHFMGEVNDRF